MVGGVERRGGGMGVWGRAVVSQGELRGCVSVVAGWSAVGDGGRRRGGVAHVGAVGDPGLRRAGNDDRLQLPLVLRRRQHHHLGLGGDGDDGGHGSRLPLDEGGDGSADDTALLLLVDDLVGVEVLSLELDPVLL